MDLENLDISPELREKAKACKSPEELLALAKTEGYRLSEEELEAVSGGGWSCGSFNPAAPGPQ
ncbi:MAG: Nif11-like leader peptide family natural product precursor [Eggerthellaceae bacterium]|nr:Nif11-like leader peptide family natural product precursor [Eggerthellaceae bacterium]